MGLPGSISPVHPGRGQGSAHFMPADENALQPGWSIYRDVRQLANVLLLPQNLNRFTQGLSRLKLPIPVVHSTSLSVLPMHSSSIAHHCCSTCDRSFRLPPPAEPSIPNKKPPSPGSSGTGRLLSCADGLAIDSRTGQGCPSRYSPRSAEPEGCNRSAGFPTESAA